MNMDNFVHDVATQIEAELARLLPPPSGPDRVLAEVMRYAALGGGKRLRPALFCATLFALGRDYRPWLSWAAALEMIHCYSLIHDDLPAMDDDDWRRGRPSCHAAYGEAMAILAGDGLLSLAAAVLARPLPQAEPHRQLAAAAEIMEDALQMVRGQAAEFAPPPGGVDLAWLEYVYAGKTAALFRAAVLGAALLAGVGEEQRRALADYAAALGLAFQITDDILDYRTPQGAVGAVIADKPDYVALAGPAAAAAAASGAAAAAEQALACFGGGADLLLLFPRLILERRD
ncbi:MAG: hypothetical protein GX572_06145 [Clostridia bacterium]|nr:hypothetical protein [Clostridia bacterium]